jgi:hypothetical protein
MLKKYKLGAMIVFDFDNFRYLGYCTWHNYMRRRPAQRLNLLLIRDDGYPYSPVSAQESGEYQLMPWLRDKMILKYITGVQAHLVLDNNYLDQNLEKTC